MKIQSNNDHDYSDTDNEGAYILDISPEIELLFLGNKHGPRIELSTIDEEKVYCIYTKTHEVSISVESGKMSVRKHSWHSDFLPVEDQIFGVKSK